MSELLLTWDENDNLNPYEEPFITIDCMTEEDFEYIKEATEHYKNLVRCKDCKHRPKENGSPYGNIWTEFPEEEICPFNCEDPFYNQMPEDDFFCARGERRGDV